VRPGVGVLLVLQRCRCSRAATSCADHRAEECASLAHRPWQMPSPLILYSQGMGMYNLMCDSLGYPTTHIFHANAEHRIDLVQPSV
jgi:hypothetical protein